MTYSNTTGVTAYGACPYIAHYSNIVDYFFYIQLPSNVYMCGLLNQEGPLCGKCKGGYIQLPSNVSLLNEYMCGPLNREGPLCRKCKDDYGTALYSYTLECSKC